MRRSVLVALVVLCAAAAQADPVVTLSIDKPQIPAGQSIYFDVRNTSDVEAALDLEIEIELGPGLDFFLTPQPAFDWSCSRVGTTTICRKARLEAGELNAIGFAVKSTDPQGGHRRADITLTARNAPAQTLVLDILATRTLTVTNAGDFGAGTLRAALEDVNDNPLCGTAVPCVIRFSELTTLVIKPATPLPAIRKCNLSIIGPDDAEFPRPSKQVAISGEDALWGNGLEIRTPPCETANGVSISGIAVHSWPWNGITYEGTSEQPGRAAHSIGWSYIGTDHTGQVARPNGARGINVDSPHVSLFVAKSVISNNGRSGVAIFRAIRADIQTSRIERNGASGVFSFGVPFTVFENTITGNRHAGIAVSRGTASAGLGGNANHSNGGLPIDWGLDDRTPADDETDGVPNAPRILDAFYDAAHNETIIRGEIRLRGTALGDDYRVVALAATSPRGDVATGRALQQQRVVVPQGVADVPFEILLVGDYRGQFIAVQGGGAGVASEISEGVIVR